MSKINSLSKQKISLIILLGVIFILGFASYSFLKNSPLKKFGSITANTALLNSPIVFGLPIHINIPSISVTATIEQMGITKYGNMEAPNGPKNAGWYKLGPRPGDIGTAVIAGHYGQWKSGEGSVFDNLNKLQKGAKIYIEDEKGTITAFVVRESRTYGKDDDATSVFTSNDGLAHLNIITCEGAWNDIESGRLYRLVVFADKINI